LNRATLETPRESKVMPTAPNQAAIPFPLRQDTSVIFARLMKARAGSGYGQISAPNPWFREQTRSLSVPWQTGRPEHAIPWRIRRVGDPGKYRWGAANICVGVPTWRAPARPITRLDRTWLECSRTDVNDPKLSSARWTKLPRWDAGQQCSLALVLSPA
jgi:hypothetical protein